MMTAMIAGFRADHTGDLVVAGWDGTQGEKVAKKGQGRLRRLVLRTRAHATSPLKIAEIWTVASVAKFVMEQWRTEAWAIQNDDPEMELLELFPTIIEKLCECLYRVKLDTERQEAQPS